MRTQIIHQRARLIGCTLATALLLGCGKEEIKVYSAPKEHFQSAQITTGQTGEAAKGTEAPLHWETPSGWKELAPTGIRLGNFLVSDGDKRAEVSIFSFPGNAGTELDNVNRWRGEISLEPITAKELSSETVFVGDETAKLFDLPGKELQTTAVILPRGNASWFFKMRGDKELVSKNKPQFLALLKSIHFHDGEGDAHAAHETKVAEKSVSTNIEKAPAASTGDSQWDVPAGWKETPPSAMVLKSFSVGESETKIAITRFPGDVGGLLANVNRWRGQLSLEPIEADELPQNITSIDVLGGKATFVDMQGTDPKTGKPARMVAASVPRDGQTWFYKMMGDDATVAREKNSFVKFVQTARYP